LINGYRGGVRIGELARATGASPRALRHYEERGLLQSRRAANGYRIYGEDSVARVRSIRYLLAAGLTLEDAAHFRCCLDRDPITATPSPAVVAVAERRLAILDERIRAITEIRDNLATELQTVVGGARHAEG
jgi:DNA-binding transcriptional MerR regulator